MLLAQTDLRLDANALDYVLVAFYFVLVLGIGLVARRSISSSLDFLLSGRSLPAWVTGLAFISANLGAIELIGMTANGAQYGIPTAHYYWVGAVPAMVFLGIVMMPFYYGSKARSVPEFLAIRFNRTTQRVQAVVFALASLLIAGVNLYALGLVLEALLGWPQAVAIPVAALVVLSYTFLGGLSAAIYNEVLQFFVILALLIPVTVAGLARVGGYSGLVEKITAGPGGAEQLSSWPGTPITEISNSFLSVFGIVFGLGFVLSFGYWTTNFAEVQRALSAKNMNAGRMTPIIGAFPKTLVPLVIVIPGMIAAVLIPQMVTLKAGGDHRRHLQQHAVAADEGGPAQRRAGRGHRRPAGGVHGRHGGQRQLVQHGVHLRHLAGLGQAGPGGPLLPQGRPRGHRRRVRDRHLHRLPGRQLLEPDGLHPGAGQLLQRAAVRDLHLRPVLQEDDRHGRLDRAGWAAWSPRCSSTCSCAPTSSTSRRRPAASSGPARRSSSAA